MGAILLGRGRRFKLVRRRAGGAVLAGVVGLAGWIPVGLGDVLATWNGTTGNWSDASKWSSPNYPNNGTPSGAIYDVTINAGTVTLDVSPTIQLLNLSGGTIQGAGNLTVNGTMSWTVGTLTGGGNTIIASGGSLSLAGGDVLTRRIDNSGTINFADGSGLIMNSGGVINNLVGGTFNMGGGTDLSASAASGLFNNSGTFIKTGAAGRVLIPFNNTGTVTVSSGSLAISAGGIHTGSFTTTGTGLLTFDGAHTFNSGSSVSGNVAFSGASGATFTFNSGSSLSDTGGTLAIGASTLTFNAGSSFSGPGSSLSVGGGTLNLNTGSPSAIAALTLAGGRIDSADNFTVNGLFDWSSGTLTGSGITTIASGGSMTLAGGDVLTRRIDNSGTINFADGSGLIMNSGGVINNLVGGTFNMGGGTDLSWSISPGAFNNSGMFIKTGTAGRILLPFSNTGTVSVQSGSLTISAAISQVATMAGVVTLTGGTWLVADGTTLNLSGGANIVANNANISLSGTGSLFPQIDTMTTNNGSFHLLSSRAFSTVSTFNNNGTLELGGGTFAAASLINGTAGTIFGFGTFANRPANGGTIRAAGGTLVLGNGVAGSAGSTIQTDAGGTLNLAGGASGTSTTALVNNGALILGGNNILVSSSYTNTGFGAGNSFNKHANVSGTGAIFAAGNNAQTLTGNVTGGGTGSPVLDFGNMHVGDVDTKSYQINNGGTSGPAVFYALQTSAGGGNVTDGRLSGTGASPGNMEAIGVGTASTSLTVIMTDSSDGPLSGQTVHIANNFDNVGEQTLGILGTAFNEAAPGTIANVNFGILHVGDTANTHLNVSNGAPADGYSENLVASVTGHTGVSVSGGPVTVTPGGVNNTALAVSLDTTAPGLGKSGTVTLHFASDGTASSGLGVTQLNAGDQVVNVNVDVLNYAAAGVQKAGGNGTFTPGDATHGILDFGVLNPGDAVSAAFSVGNGAMGPADTLAGSWTAAAPDFAFSGVGAFVGIAAGNLLSSPVVGFTAGNSGIFVETLTLHPLSQNNAPFSAALADYVLTLKATVNPLGATWNGGTGVWSDGLQWTSSPVAPNNGVPSNIIYDAMIGAGDVTLDVDISIRSVTISGGSLSTVAHSLNVPNGAIVAGGTLNLSGTASLTGSVTVSAGGILSQTGGTLSASMLTQSAGTITLGGTQTSYDIPTVAISGGTTILPTATARKVLATGNLTLSGGKLDLMNNFLIVHSADPTTEISVLRAYYGSGALFSSTQTPLETMVIVSANLWFANVGAGASFGGHAVAAGDVLARVTYPGDANLDGIINIDDYLVIDSHYAGAETGLGYLRGDFDLSGVIDAADYALIDNSFHNQSGPLADGMIAAHAAEFGQQYVTALEQLNPVLAAQSVVPAVPEPGSLMILSVAALSLLGVRRREGRTQVRQLLD